MYLTESYVSRAQHFYTTSNVFPISLSPLHQNYNYPTLFGSKPITDLELCINSGFAQDSLRQKNLNFVGFPPVENPSFVMRNQIGPIKLLRVNVAGCDWYLVYDVYYVWEPVKLLEW